MKTCPKCKVTKPLDEFSRQASTRDGRYPYCKVCATAAHRQAYALRGKKSWMNDKTCTICKVLKPKTLYRQTDGKHHARCMACEDTHLQMTAKGLKQCNVCDCWLEPDKFYPSKVHLPRTACAQCTRDYANSKGDQRRAKNLLKEYGMTFAMYDELVEKQGGKCPVCLGVLEPGNRSYHVDHAHTGVHAGRIRAIVHGECNRTVLWMHDDPAQLRAAADLVENPLTDWYVPGKPQSEKRGELARVRREANKIKTERTTK